jgi:hypothetical protein
MPIRQGLPRIQPEKRSGNEMPKEREGKGVKKKYCKLCLEKVAFVD